MRDKLWLDIPEPSKLYSLEPIGVGTPETESLASYAMRVAEAHSIDVCYLIHRFIYPALKKGQWKDSQTKRKGNRIRQGKPHRANSSQLEISKWLDMTPETQATVEVLSSLTKRSDLRWLTLLPLSGYVKQEGILRAQRAWCRQCYEDQKESDGPIYDLLAWSFQEVNVCPRHEQNLWRHCYWCNARQPLLKSLSQPGFCSKCGSWLGSKQSHRNKVSSSDLWKAENVGNIIASWANLPPNRFKKRYCFNELLLIAYGLRLRLSFHEDADNSSLVPSRFFQARR
jgi:hypothetical protein